MMHQLRSVVRAAGGDIHGFYVCPDTDVIRHCVNQTRMLFQAQEDFV